MAQIVALGSPGIQTSDGRSSCYLNRLHFDDEGATMDARRFWEWEQDL